MRFLVILAPRAGSWLHTLMLGFDPAPAMVRFVRYLAAVIILTAALLAAHVLLPVPRNRFSSIWPGAAFIVTAWTLLAAASSFSLRSFAGYSNYYAVWPISGPRSTSCTSRP